MSAPRPTWLFDDSPIGDPLGYGERAVGFLRSLRHPKSRLPDQTFQLYPWQERLVRRIYGPIDDQGRRLTRVVYLQVGRGARKTSLGAGLAALHTFGYERQPDSENIVAAADRKQARIAFEELVGIIDSTPWLAGKLRVMDYRNRVSHTLSRSTLEAISADAATQHGRTPVFALVDELHAHKKADLWHVIRTGLVKVPGSLLIVATTAGRGTETPDFPIYEYAVKVARGEIDDPGFLPVIFEAPRDCDWRDEKVWADYNPGLVDGYPDLAGLRQLAREAAERPADRDAFCQFHLGIRQEHSTSPFVSMDVFDEGRTKIDVESLRGRQCWLAIDMSSTTDLSAVVAAFPDDAEGFDVLCWVFCPADNLQARADRDGAPYPRWAEEGWLIATPGQVIDYRAIESLIRDLCERYQVEEIAFDPAYATPVMSPLLDDGFPVVTVRQGWVTQSPALNALDRAIVGRKIRWNSPALRWCMSNVSIHTDSAGNRTMHKGRSRDRIDAAVACWMAVSRASAGHGMTSIYESSELRFV